MPKSEYSINVINGTKWIDLQTIRVLHTFEKLAKRLNVKTYSVTIDHNPIYKNDDINDHEIIGTTSIAYMANRNDIYYEYDEGLGREFAWVEPIASIDMNNLELTVYD